MGRTTEADSGGCKCENISRPASSSRCNIHFACVDTKRRSGDCSAVKYFTAAHTPGSPRSSAAAP